MDAQIQTMIAQHLKAQHQRMAAMLTKLDELTKKRNSEVNEEVSRNSDRFPSFDGVNTRNWVGNCSRYFAMYKIPESQRVEVASIHLTGRAAAWFASYSAVRKNFYWCDFILDICNRFKDELGSQVIGDCYKLHQSGSASLMLHKTPELSDESFITSFGEGLKTHLKPCVKALNPLALGDATPFARPREEAAEALQMPHKSSMPKSLLLAAPRAESEEVQSSRKHIDLDDFLGDLCVRFHEDKGIQFKDTAKIDALEVSDKSPKRGPKLVLSKIGGEEHLGALKVFDQSPKRGPKLVLPKRVPKLVFSQIGGELRFVAFDPGGLEAVVERAAIPVASQRVGVWLTLDPGGLWNLSVGDELWPTSKNECGVKCEMLQGFVQTTEFNYNCEHLSKYPAIIVLIHTMDQARAVKVIEHDVGCRFQELPPVVAGFRAKPPMQLQSQPCTRSTVSGDSSKETTLASGVPFELSEELHVNNQDMVNSVLNKFMELNLDENLGHVTEDQTDEITLFHQVKDLAKHVKEQKEWAQEKALQAAKKLSNVLTELKLLRMERKETQRWKKGKQALNDTTMKRLGDLQQPAPEVNDQGENWLPPAQKQTKQRGGGRGRTGAHAAALVKGAQTAVGAKQTGTGRGRGVRLIALDPELPCEVLPPVAPLGAVSPAQNRVEGVTDKDIAMEGASVDKLVAAEEEANLSPVPDRVQVGNSPMCKIERKLIKGGFDRVQYKGRQGKYCILVMDMLGPSLRDVWNSLGQSVSPNVIASPLPHSKGFVHGEIQDDGARVTVAAEGQLDGIMNYLEDMVRTHVEKPNCIILAISPANQDIVTSDAIKLARAVDPSGDRYLSLQGVKKVASDANDYHPHLISLEQGHQRLIEVALNYFKGPAEASVDAVHFVLKELALVAAAIVVFDPGGAVSHTNDELSMRAFESVATFCQSTAPKGGCFLYGGRKPDTGRSWQSRAGRVRVRALRVCYSVRVCFTAVARFHWPPLTTARAFVVKKGNSPLVLA